MGANRKDFSEEGKKKWLARRSPFYAGKEPLISELLYRGYTFANIAQFLGGSKKSALFFAKYHRIEPISHNMDLKDIVALCGLPTKMPEDVKRTR